MVVTSSTGCSEAVIDLVEVDPLLKRVGLTLMTGADKLGFRIDHVFEAARLMRLPGTLNCKPGLDRPFVSYKDWGCRYSPTDFAGALLPLPPRGSRTSSRVSEHVRSSTPPRQRTRPSSHERPWERFDALVGARGVLQVLGEALKAEFSLESAFTEVGQDADGTVEYHYARATHRNSVGINAEDKLIIWSDTLANDSEELLVEEVRSPQKVVVETSHPFRPNEFWVLVAFKGSWAEAALWFAREFPARTTPALT